jgi:dCMP deaminase
MNLQDHNKWDLRFLDLAKLVSGWSKDPSTKVGAVIVDGDNRVVSIGYNGFPIGINDDDERLNNRELKYKMIIHAECNALMFANTNLVGYTMYTYPFMPCPKCASMIIQSGITRVISYENKIKRWEDDFEISRQLFCQAKVVCLEYLL